MKKFEPHELLPIFEQIQHTLTTSPPQIAESLEDACLALVTAFFQQTDSLQDIGSSATTAEDSNKIIELLQNREIEWQEMGLELLHQSQDTGIWHQITKGFQLKENEWFDPFFHETYRITLGIIRAWAENPSADHSDIKTLRLHTNATKNCTSIAFVRNFPNVESVDVSNLVELQNLSGLEQATNLIELHARNTMLPNLEGLGNNPALQTIIIKDCAVHSLQGLQTTHPELSINAQNTKLDDVSAIPSEADAYLCCDQPPTIGSPAITYLRISDKRLPDLQQYPNVHTLYIDNPLICATGLLDLPKIQHLFVSGYGLRSLFDKTLYDEISPALDQSDLLEKEQQSIMFGGSFRRFNDKALKNLLEALKILENKRSRIFPSANKELWQRCKQSITDVRLRSYISSSGVTDYRDITDIPNLKNLTLELHLRRSTLQLIIPTLPNLKSLSLISCSVQRFEYNTRQILKTIEIDGIIPLEELTIAHFPALGNNFLRTFPIENFPNLKRLYIRSCPKLSQRIAKKQFPNVEIKMT